MNHSEIGVLWPPTEHDSELGHHLAPLPHYHTDVGKQIPRLTPACFVTSQTASKNIKIIFGTIKTPKTLRNCCVFSWFKYKYIYIIILYYDIYNQLLICVDASAFLFMMQLRQPL
jgi:hypothetical protein